MPDLPERLSFRPAADEGPSAVRQPSLTGYHIREKQRQSKKSKCDLFLADQEPKRQVGKCRSGAGDATASRFVMMTEQQQNQATRYALGQLSPLEEQEFVAQVRADPELRQFLHSLQKILDELAASSSFAAPPASLKERVMRRLHSETAPQASEEEKPPGERAPGLHFMTGSDSGWKPLPVQGAFIKLLSLQRDRGYAVLLGKLDRGVRYPAHTNVGPEDFYILSGDLHVGDQALGPGDFHHADAGSLHTENYSVEGCTLLAVLSTDDPLVQQAIG